MRCQALLDAIGAADSLAAAGGEQVRLPRRGGLGQALKPGRWEWPARLLGGVRRRLFIWRRRLVDGLPEGVQQRRPWTAGLLSVVPGAGQLYNRQPKKALWFGLAVGAWGGLVAATWRQPWNVVVLWGWLALSAWAFHDGVITAKRINRDYLPWQHLVAFYCAWIALACGAIVGGQYLTRQEFAWQLKTVLNDGLEPKVQRGESVLVDHFYYRWHEPRVGEVVAYRPGRIKVAISTYGSTVENVYDPKDFGGLLYGMIVAGPGQTLERKNGVLLRDGRALGPEERPERIGLIKDFKLTAPAGSYVILFDQYNMSFSFITKLARYQVLNWEEVCVVGRGQIRGRVRAVYYPPQRRRVVK